MLPSVVKVFLICLYLYLCLCNNEATTDIPKDSSVPAVIAFGNSYFDSGNNNLLKTIIKADFPPYGKDFIGGKPTGRFTNNKTLADYVAKRLGVKDYLPAYLDPSLQDEDMVTGLSFASAGSGLDPTTNKLVNVLSLSDQVEMFKVYIVKLKGIVGEEEANNIISKSLYLVTSSTNDWAISYTVIPVRRIQYDVTTYASLLVEKETEFIQEMFKLGARKMIFFNTPIIGCFPIGRTLEGGEARKCGDPLNEEVQTFNTMLNRQIQFLGSNLPQSRFTIVDYFKIVHDIIENSLQYGMYVLVVCNILVEYLKLSCVKCLMFEDWREP
ncbi:GDSL esterase/lipase At5g42170-like [Bidens hawaiensis]|uniref:GDSL esterase/lipase At5g42170-like n=1 Tax=Bidens hawaiensis TaxID=980011 RepID=UPI0040496805